MDDCPIHFCIKAQSSPNPIPISYSSEWDGSELDIFMTFAEDMDTGSRPFSADRWIGIEDEDVLEWEDTNWTGPRTFRVTFKLNNEPQDTITIEYLTIGQDFKTAKGITVGLFKNDNVPLPV